MSVDASSALNMLVQFPARAHKRLVTVMQKVGLDFLGYVRINKLHGQVLHQRSGRLSSKLHDQTDDNGRTVTTTVGVDSNAVPYAAIHEYGFHGQEHVRAHARTISLAFGHEIEPVTVQVGGFTRMMNMPERSYLRSSLKERRETYIDWVRGAVSASA